MNRYSIKCILASIFGIFSILLTNGQKLTLPSSSDHQGDSIKVFPSLLTEEIIAQNENFKILSLEQSERKYHLALEKQNLHSIFNAVIGISDAYLAYGNNRIAFSKLKELIAIKDRIEDEKAKAHLYYNLAVVFARQKMYSIALRCFYQTSAITPKIISKIKRNRLSNLDRIIQFQASNGFLEDIENLDLQSVFSENVIDASILQIDTSDFAEKPIDGPPVIIDPSKIAEAFDDGKPAKRFAVAIQIKQPKPGKKNVYAKLNDVGHSYITLIKYNLDGSSVTKSFGFYSQQGFIFAATPLFPKTQPVIKDDSNRGWDEFIGKFISEEQFLSVLDYLEDRSVMPYHLNKNNCADFALGIAKLAGIQIEDGIGHWPFGSGNNPGTIGYRILTGKFKNLETNSLNGLFACTNNLFGIK